MTTDIHCCIGDGDAPQCVAARPVDPSRLDTATDVRCFKSCGSITDSVQASSAIGDDHEVAAVGRKINALCTVPFAAAIALREIGIANEIINLAFGITLLAIGLAVALSFGLGTQKIAERELDSFLINMRTPKNEE